MLVYLIPLAVIWLLLITPAWGVPDGIKKVVNIVLIVLILIFVLLGLR